MLWTEQTLGGGDAEAGWHCREWLAPPPLRPFLTRAVWFSEWGARPVLRPELPAGRLSLIVGDPLRVGAPGAPVADTTLRAFVAGLHDAPALTAHAGAWSGLQLELTPIGARRLFGLPLYELTGRDVPVGDLFGSAGSAAAADLLERDDPDGRLEALLAWTLPRLMAAPAPERAVRRAWQHVEATGGRATVADLCDLTGWSRRHLGARFRDAVGLSPKRVAQLVRAKRAADLIALRPALPLARVAAVCGYADQPHLSRDLARFMGSSPAHLRERVTFLHDPAAAPA